MTAANGHRPRSGLADEGTGDWAIRLQGTTLNTATMMGTDYLNHFNEAIMILEMLPAMPEGIQDLAAWHPLTYPEHFRRSRLPYAPLAVLAFDAAPETCRRALDLVVERMNAQLLDAIDAVVMAATSDQWEVVHDVAHAATPDLRRLVQLAADIINGVRLIESAADMDRYLAASGGLGQDEIDGLFA